jgi:peptide deformylase
MTILKILTYGTPSLREPSKEVGKISKKISSLIKDMIATMYSYNGVGLAASQVGENLRIFVIDVSAEEAPNDPIVFINPKIIKKSGAINSYEGCLSFPDAYTDVRRYANVKVKALDQSGKPFVIEATKGTLLARALQHEFDHLEGVLFIDHARNRFQADMELQQKGLPPVDVDYILEEDELEEKIAKTSTADSK